MGVVATPIKEGNTRFIVEEALKAAQNEGPVETELVHLQDYRIEPCVGCDGCMRRIHKIQKEVGLEVVPVPIKTYNCGIRDDMEILHQKLVESDGLILGTPVYIASIPGQLKVFIDRCRTFVHDYRLRSKAAGSITVAFYRSAGQDTTLNLMNLSLLAVGYTVVSVGASTVSSKEGLGIPIKETRFAAGQDPLGMMMVRSVGSQVAQTAITLKAGKLALEAAGMGLQGRASFEIPGSG
ncbi:MAG: flavodoxin family protein [Candidatus Tectomicrobia bacterium]|uniref:Flavodoxin family protein n=1 Tax=Tectimicrobiota bacterium TaxID=2528274 RepID=A0A932FY50_UNCTE|nr:flavodoxin family protein [Candidatus Tectomicrobia bacterium]